MCVCVVHIFFIHSTIDKWQDFSFVLAEKYSIVYIYYFFFFFNLFIHLWTQLASILAILNGAAWNMEMQVSLSWCFFPSDKYLRVELLDHIVVLFNFWGTSVLFSTVAAPIYIPTSGVQEFLFLRFFTNTYFLSFW